MEVDGWAGPGLTRNFFGKSSQNSFKPLLLFWRSIPSVFCWLKVVSYYDLSFLSMSVMGLDGGGCVG